MKFLVFLCAALALAFWWYFADGPDSPLVAVYFLVKTVQNNREEGIEQISVRIIELKKQSKE